MYEHPRASRALFDQYEVDYIYVSSSERGYYAVDLEALDEMYPLVFDNGVRVYAVSERARAADHAAAVRPRW